MKLFEIFKSEGGFRVCLSEMNGNPVISKCPWFARKCDATKRANRERAKENEWRANQERETGVALSRV